MPRIWDLINETTRKRLTKYQKRHYGNTLTMIAPDPAVTVVGKIEDVEEIDRILRSPPGPKWRDG